MKSYLNILSQSFSRIFFVFTLILITNVNSQTQDTLWSENWEGSWTNNWHVDAGTWEVGTPASGPESAYEGQNVAATVLSGNYSEPVDSRLIRHMSFIVPSALENPRLRFLHWYSFSAGDYGKIQIKVDGEEWQDVFISYTGSSSATWSKPFLDLSAFAGLSVQIAFYFHSEKVGYYSNTNTGWYIDNIQLITGAIIFNIPEGFESGLGDWASERGSWEVGEPTSGPNQSFKGKNCAATTLTGNYAEPVDTRLISPTFVVPPISDNPALQFWHWYSFSDGDYGIVQIKVGSREWKTISNQFTSSSSDAWTNFYVSIQDYADSLIQISFNFHSEKVGYYSNTNTGWYIDDIDIVGYVTNVDGMSSDKVPPHFTLLQNYPNPFNPATNIRFGLPKAGSVKLEVYNNLGQEVVTLIDEFKTAGYYEVTFNVDNFSSGVYFYRIQAEDFQQVRKMLLLQ